MLYGYISLGYPLTRLLYLKNKIDIDKLPHLSDASTKCPYLTTDSDILKFEY